MVQIELLSSASPSSSKSISRWKYDVFLSFCGKDTRNKFADHLYDALDQRGIITFRDDTRLERGQDFALELLKVIGESWCSIIVFSESYAGSSWCLKELAEIIKQKNERGHNVYPIFYDMEAFLLRRQQGSVEEAFAKHEERYDKDEVAKWRTALSEAAHIHGWTSKDRSESKLIKHLVNKISTKLFQTYTTAPDDLIGIHSRLEELCSKLNIGGDGVRVVGICGMGGIGKTTLARVVYDQRSPEDFEGESFLLDVREVSKESSGLVSLQKQLLSEILLDEDLKFSNVLDGNIMISHRLRRKKVFIVIDDADHEKQLRYLVGRRDWFGPGSRIIITTRDEHLLRSYGVDDVFKPKSFDANEAFEFFTLKAFNKDTVPEKDLIELSQCVIKYADGLPLALEVLGCFFHGISDVAEWQKAIERVKRDSNKEIHERLKIGFDGLEETEKDIFLDIACFFVGEEKDFVMKILDGCGLFSDIGLKALVNKSLVTVDGYNRLRMHDLLREMGRKIVWNESPKEPGKRSRLCEENDVCDVLTENSATDAIEGMIIDTGREQNEVFTSIADEVFSKMKILRLLRVFNLPNCGDITYLSNKLALFEWHRFPLKSLPSSFRPNSLVALLLPYGHIEQLWKGEIKSLKKLKLLNLHGCKNMIKAPDFTTTPNLENLILEGCTKMKQLPSSIGHLSSLVLLNLKDCRNLACLPNSIDGCQRLKTLNLSGCSKVENLPENLQHVEVLMELDLSGTAIRRPQSFIFQFKNLKLLSFKGCRGGLSKFLPYWLQRRTTNSMALSLQPLSGLSSITYLDLSDCNLVEGAIPSDISRLSSLKSLILSGNNFITLPATLSRLSNLYLLRLSNCKGLKFLPESLTSIQIVDIDGCVSLEVVPNPKIVCSSKDGHGTSINCGNCFGLIANTNGITLLKRHLKVFAYTRKSMDIFIPGSEIPEWFSHYRFEHSISEAVRIELPRNSRKGGQWMGVALCCVLASSSGFDEWGDEDIQIIAVTYVGNSRQVVPGFYTYYTQCQVKNDHLWLQYWPRRMFYRDFSEENCSEIEDLACQENDVIDFLFKPFRVDGVRPQVKKFGIQLVYEKDVEEMDFVDNHQETDGPKRKRDVFDEEAEDRSKPKRLKRILDFVTGLKQRGKSTTDH